MGYSNEKPAILDTMPEKMASDLIAEVGSNLFEDWYNSNLDEGQLLADYELATSTDSDEVKRFFNTHWELTPDDEFYIGEGE